MIDLENRLTPFYHYLPSVSQEADILPEQISNLLQNGGKCILLVNHNLQIQFYKQALLNLQQSIDENQLLITTFRGLYYKLLPFSLFRYNISTRWQSLIILKDILAEYNFEEHQITLPENFSYSLKQFPELILDFFQEMDSQALFTDEISITKLPEEFQQLIEIYQLFHTRLQEKNLETFPVCFLKLLQKNQSELGKAPFFPADQLIVRGFRLLNRVEKLFLAGLIPFTRQAKIDLPIFMIEDEKAYITTEQDQAESIFQLINNLIFQDHNSTGAKISLTRTHGEKISICCCSSQHTEIHFIRKQIHQWLNSGTPPEQIAIISHNSSWYQELILQHLTRDGIPVNYHRSMPWSNTFPGQLLLTYINMLLSDLSHQSVLRFFALFSQRGNSLSEEARLIALTTGVRSGLENWRSIPENYLSSAENFSTHKIRKIKNNYLKVYKILSNLQLPAKGEIATLLEQFLKKISYLLSNQFIQLEDEQVTSINKIILAFYQQVLQLNLSEQELDLSEFLILFQDFIQQESFTEAAGPSGIMLRELSSITGLRWKRVILVGMNEKVLPAAATQNPFLSEEKVQQVNDSGVFRFQELALTDRLNKMLFKEGLTSACRELIITYPISSTSSSQLNPSPFLHQLKQILNRLPEDCWEEQNVNSSPITSLESCQTYTDLLINRQFPLISQKVSLPDEPLRKILQKRKRYSFLSYQERIFPIAKRLKRHFRATEPETYFFCPFKYFASYILGLTKLKESGLELLPLTEGVLLHKVLANVVEEFKQEKATNWKEWLRENSNRITGEILNKWADNFRPLNLSIHDKLWSFIVQSLQNILLNFIKYEICSYQDFDPLSAEQEFNLSLKLKENASDSVTISGRIDRIDIEQSGKFYRIIDYKRSDVKSPFSDETKYLQLFFYFLGIQELYNTDKISEGYLYILRKAQPSAYYKPGIKGKSLSEIENFLIQKMESLVNNLDNGRFPVTPLKPGECSHLSCDYYTICRLEK